MKNKFARLFSIIGLVLMTYSLCLSCDPIDGEDGTDGVDGTDGADGEDGIGIDDLAQYGSISLTMTGNRPDDDSEFTHESTLRFIHNEPGNNNLSPSNFLLEIKQPEESNLAFNVLRFLNSPNSNEANSVGFYLEVIDEGLESEDYVFNLFFDDFYLLFDDLKYVVFSRESYFYDDKGVSNFAITDYSFDESTNNLKFSFSFDVHEEFNITDNDLTISGTVDVIVFKNIGYEEFDQD